MVDVVVVVDVDDVVDDVGDDDVDLVIAVDRLRGGAHFLILLQRSTPAPSDQKYNTDHAGHHHQKYHDHHDNDEDDDNDDDYNADDDDDNVLKRLDWGNLGNQQGWSNHKAGKADTDECGNKSGRKEWEKRE